MINLLWLQHQINYDLAHSPPVNIIARQPNIAKKHRKHLFNHRPQIRNEKLLLHIELFHLKTFLTFGSPIKAMAKQSFLFMPPEIVDTVEFFFPSILKICNSFIPSCSALILERPFNCKILVEIYLTLSKAKGKLTLILFFRNS